MVIFDEILYLYERCIYFKTILIGLSKFIYIIIFKYAQYVCISRYREIYETVYTLYLIGTCELYR